MTACSEPAWKSMLGVNVLRILAENDDVDFSGRFTGKARPEILHGRSTRKVQQLAQGDIQRPDAAPTGWSAPFDAHQEFLESLDRIVRQPIVEFVLDVSPYRLQTRPPSAFHRRPLHCGIKHALAGRPYIRTGAVTANKGRIGSSGTISLPPSLVILPPAGGVMSL